MGRSFFLLQLQNQNFIEFNKKNTYYRKIGSTCFAMDLLHSEYSKLRTDNFRGHFTDQFTVHFANYLPQQWLFILVQ